MILENSDFHVMENFAGVAAFFGSLFVSVVSAMHALPCFQIFVPFRSLVRVTYFHAFLFIVF